MVIPLSNRFSPFETNEEESPYGLDEEDSEEESNKSVKQADAPAAASAEAADTGQKIVKKVKFDLENIPIRKLLTSGGRANAPEAASTSSSSTSSSSTQQPSMAVDTTGDRAVRAKIGDHVGSPPPEAALVKRQRFAAIAEIADKATDAETFFEKISGVIDLLDSDISLQEKAAARHIQLETLWRLNTFEPQLKWETTKRETVYPHTWVDVKSKGEIKSRFTVADSVKH